MNKHTAGPWRESGNWYLTTSSGTAITCTAITSGGHNVAAVITDTGEIENWGEMRANAKLIAVAPELLQKYKILKDVILETTMLLGGWGEDERIKARVIALRRAVTRAEVE